MLTEDDYEKMLVELTGKILQGMFAADSELYHYTGQQLLERIEGSINFAVNTLSLLQQKNLLHVEKPE